jgi:hypothetical protein
MKSKSKHSTAGEVVEKLIAQIEGFYSEMSVLSKGKPDNPLNAFKLKFINDKLTEANGVLVGEYQPLTGFTIFDDTALPTNSDVVFVLSQYINRLKAWRRDNRTSPIPDVFKDWN